MWKEQGKGVSFFFFSIIEWLGKGVRVFFLLICRRAMGGGGGRFIFYKFIIGFRVGGG